MQLLEFFPYLYIVARSLAVYLFILVALRIFGKKELAQLTVMDLVFIMLISNSVQNAMVGSDTSLSGGLLAACSLFLVNFLLKKLTYRYKKINELVQGKPILLIYNGEVLYENIEKASISIAELETAIREHGEAETKDIYMAMFEVDGNISIVSSSPSSQTKHATKKKRVSHTGLLKDN